MGLSAIFKAAAGVAFKVAGDIRTEVTLYTSPTYAHDIGTDEDAPTWGGTVTALGVLYDRTEKKEADAAESVKKTLLLQAADLGAANVTQESEVDIASQRWKVETVNIDPAGATVELLIYR